MRSLCCAAVSLLTLATAARADVCVRTPWVTVQVSRGGVFVQTPCVTVSLPRAAPVMPPAAATPDPMMLHAPRPVDAKAPPPAPPTPAVVVPTLAQFAATFTPQPGRHEVVLLHPATGQPVKVGFTLPPGAPRRVRLYRYRLAFDYDRNDIVLVFARNGGVRVRD